ncbi:S-adenosyl-L-methionine-dependent methyltransferase [Pilobolus umbonatus]|nr:S-adenosyl-L-methionine-dependent methyltransferase [Pilobolus umbonatus]
MALGVHDVYVIQVTILSRASAGLSKRVMIRTLPKRKFHHVQNSAYWLPNDDEEMDRLIGQHFALKTLFGGISNDLDLERNEALVLDLGCGPGTWIMDAATEYPLSQFIGVDMCDVFPNNVRPPNVSFLVDNVLEKLNFPDNTFDFINIRLFIIAMKKEEWPIVLKEAYRLLKPGGYLQCVECGMLEQGNSFVQYAGQTFKEMIDDRGQDPFIGSKLSTLLEAMDFNIIHYENKGVYLGNPDPLSKEFLWDATNIFKAVEPILRGVLGHTEETYPHFLDILYRELQKQPETLWRWFICVGQK